MDINILVKILFYVLVYLKIDNFNISANKLYFKYSDTHLILDSTSVFIFKLSKTFFLF